MAIRLGFVGGGFIAEFHARSLRSVKGAELAGLMSRTPPTALAEKARAWGLGEAVVYGTVEELAHNVDVVVLLNPNFARLEAMEAVVRAVESGASLSAVACEKPLARNLAEAGRMLNMAAATGVQTVFLENQVHLPAIQAAREQLASVTDAMGPLTLARAAEEHAGPHNGWFWDPRRQGGGVLCDMGCHSIAVGWHLLTPAGKGVRYLVPERVSAEIGLLKWGHPKWRAALLDRYGVDYNDHPAEDFATGTITYRDPETQRRSMAQFTVSWMYDKQGLRLLIDGMGAGYALEINSLRSPLEVFIGDAAAAEIADAERALEKATAGRGLLAVQPNEPDLYGYVDELRDLVAAVEDGRPPLLDWGYGRDIVRLTMAAYMSAERGVSVDLSDPQTSEELESYVPLVQQGRGREVLHVTE